MFTHQPLSDLADRLCYRPLVDTVSCPVCVQCDVPPVMTRAGLSAILKGTDPFIFFSEAAPQRIRLFAPELHMGHHVVSVDGRFSKGETRDPAMTGLLRLIDPRLAAPQAKFQEQLEVPQAVTDELGRLGIGNLNHEIRTGRTYLERIGRGEVGVPRGSYRIGTQADRDLGVRAQRFDFWARNKQICVMKFSGVQRLGALIHRSRIKTEQLCARYAAEPAEDRARHVAELLAWYLLDALIAARGDQVLIEAVEPLGTEVAPVADVIKGLPLDDEARLLLRGDVAILEYHASHASTLFPAAGSAVDLLASLDDAGYPRAPRSTDRDPHQRLHALLKDLAIPLEVAWVMEIDWSPVMKAVKFKQSVKKPG